MSIPESKRPAAVLSSPHETRLCFFRPSKKAEDGPRMYQEQGVTREIASRLRGQMSVSRSIKHAQAVVSATLVCQHHAITSQIASGNRGQMLGSQWIEHAQAVVSATLVYREPAITSQIASENRGRMLVPQWIEHAQVVVSATLLYRNHAIASEIASQVVVWDTADVGTKQLPGKFDKVFVHGFRFAS
jgi:adenosine deaminase